MFYINFWLKAFDYKSSVNRLTYFLVWLSNLLIAYYLIEYETDAYSDDGRIQYLFYLQYNLATFIPWLAFCARRLNSMKVSRSWALMQFVPIANNFMSLVLIFPPEKD